MFSFPQINVGVIEENGGVALPNSSINYPNNSNVFRNFWTNINTGACACVIITTTGSVSQQFVLSWGDGTFSTGTSATQLNHAYSGSSCASVGTVTPTGQVQVTGNLTIGLCTNGAAGCNPNITQFVNLNSVVGYVANNWSGIGQQTGISTYPTPYLTKTGYKIPNSGLITTAGSGYWLAGPTGGYGRNNKNYTLTTTGQLGEQYIYNLYYSFY